MDFIRKQRKGVSYTQNSMSYELTFLQKLEPDAIKLLMDCF